MSADIPIEDRSYSLVRKQDKRSKRYTSGVHMQDDNGSFTGLCAIDVRNVGNPREVWVEVDTTLGVTCRACKTVYMARRLYAYATVPGPLKTTVVMDFATWFEKNTRGEHHG